MIVNIFLAAALALSTPVTQASAPSGAQSTPAQRMEHIMNGAEAVIEQHQAVLELSVGLASCGLQALSQQVMPPGLLAVAARDYVESAGLADPTGEIAFGILTGAVGYQLGLKGVELGLSLLGANERDQLCEGVKALGQSFVGEQVSKTPKPLSLQPIRSWQHRAQIRGNAPSSLNMDSGSLTEFRVNAPWRSGPNAPPSVAKPARAAHSPKTALRLSENSRVL